MNLFRTLERWANELDDANGNVLDVRAVVAEMEIELYRREQSRERGRVVFRKGNLVRVRFGGARG